MTRRQANFIGLVACYGMMAYALFAQYALELAPCPLCIFQRVAVIALGIVFLLAALHHPAGWGRYVYAGLIALVAGGGAAVAGRHVWLQNLPPERVPACGPDLGFLLETIPFAQVLRQVFTGSGECAVIDWSFLGLSMPAWVLIAVSVVGLAGVGANLRLRHGREG